MEDKICLIKDFYNTNIEVLTFGHFNTIHHGHIRFLEYAKSKGKNLTVALIGDKIEKGKRRFQFSQSERAKSLILLPLIDKIVLLKDDEIDLLVERSKPKYLILGREYEGNINPNIKKAIFLNKSNKRNVIFHSGDIQYSSKSLLNTSEKILEERRRKEFKLACSRSNLDKNKLLKSINRWKSAKLLVVGDIILDQYAACDALGMSAEAPVLVVKELKCKNFIGGAGIVAANIASLGAKCDFVSVIGDDENAIILKKKLSRYGINSHLIEDKSRPTTFKKRYVVDNQKLFRVSKLEDHFLSKSKEEELIKKIKELAKTATGIIISDFVYGVITDNVLEQIVLIAKKYKLPLFGDLQCSTQLGSILKFKDFSLLSPNEKEARIAIQNKEISLELLSQKILEETNAQNLIMKLGSDGFIIYAKAKDTEIFSQPFPALVPNPVDVTGAGDALLAAMAVGMSIKEDTLCTAAIACCQASLAVKTMGNVPIDFKDLNKEIIFVLD